MTHNVCWYDVNKRELLGSQWSKVKAYNRDKLITETQNNTFELLALKGNKQVHTVFFDGLNNSCSCQWYQIKGLKCTHIWAVEYYLHIKNGVTE